MLLVANAAYFCWNTVLLCSVGEGGFTDDSQRMPDDFVRPEHSRTTKGPCYEITERAQSIVGGEGAHDQRRIDACLPKDR
jgi:hypothetical protein